MVRTLGATVQPNYRGGDKTKKKPGAGFRAGLFARRSGQAAAPRQPAFSSAISKYLMYGVCTKRSRNSR